jgi:hypothetical protein
VSDVGVARTGHASWRPAERHRDVLLATLVVAVGSLAVLVTGVRGADYPAQQLRAELWRQAGFTVWNNYWYAGHPTINYSLITPALMGVFGAVAVGIVASVIATACFTDLLRTSLPGVSTRWGGVMFALATVVNIIVGRVSFAAGLACALVAVWAWQRGRLVVAVVMAFVTPLASPVAASFLAIGAAAVFLDAMWPRVESTSGPGSTFGARLRSARPAIAIGAAATSPLLLMTVVVGSEGGTFPFRGGHFLLSSALLALAWMVVPNRIVRIGLAISVAASVVLFVVPTPLGGNFVRLAQFIAVPLAVAGAVRFAHPKAGEAHVTIAVRLLVIGGALTGAVWTLHHAVVAAVDWAGDASTDRSFHQPLIDEVRARNSDGLPLGRLEIPFTANHWESYYVADQVPYIRGWERQIDLSRNAVLYDPSLTADQLHAWALVNAVRWIALPDAPLDLGGQPEADVLNGGGARSGAADGFELVWQNDDWRLYEVLDHQPIVEPPAVLVSQSPDEIVVSTTEAATVIVRYHFQPGTSISLAASQQPSASDGRSEACLAETEDGWISARLPVGGTYVLRIGADSLLLGGSNAECDG